MTNFPQACLKFAGSLALALTAVLAPSASASAQTAQAKPSSPSSPNGRILFQSTQGSDSFVNEIYSMEADGKRQVRLTYNDFDDASPVWSPQGDRIAFLSMRGDAGYDIFVMNPDGSGERPLRDAEHGGPLVTNNIEWSPDGRRIMYNVGGKIYVVEVFDSVGGYSDAPAQNLSETAPAFAFDSGAVWSRDGSKLAFTSRGCESCFPDLFVINADGTGRAQLTTTFDAEFSPVWTPSGRIAYGSFRDNGSNTYVINPDGTGDQLFNDAVMVASGPVWSPDGASVVFGSSGPASAPRPGLYKMNSDGTGLMFLTDEVNGGGRIVWSPDGSMLVAHVVNDANWIDVVCFDANSTNRHVKNMTKTRKADEFAWSWQRLQTQ